MAYFQKKGLTVAPFKVGPDFIDPGHHTRITGTISRNLDGWMLTREYNEDCFRRHAASADIAIVEGVMGLFDGYSGTSEEGSTAQMAKWNTLPVILVVNAQSMARSAAAIVQGFENFDPDLKFAGVIFNKVGSDRHLAYLTEAMEGNSGIPVLGGIFRDEEIEIPERHLGLVTNDEHILSAEAIDKLAGLIEANIDIAKLLDNVKEYMAPEPYAGNDAKSEIQKEHRVKIGVARDQAFCFYYKDNIEILESFGAEIVYFSPMEDSKLPDGINGIYFGGGYPELFAKKLSDNKSLLEEIKAFSETNMPLYGECGGFMYLCNDIRDHDGDTYKMTGCLPFSLRMLNKLKTLGYREVVIKKDSVLGETGHRVRGHEFHYSEIINTDEKAETVYSVQKRVFNSSVEEGYTNGNTLGSYIHLHFGSNLNTAENFVASCRRWMLSDNVV